MTNANPLELKSVPNVTDPENWLNTEQAAELMGLEPRKFRDYSSKHKLERMHEANRVYYRRELILAEIGRRESRKTMPAAASETPAPAAPVPVSKGAPVNKLAVLNQLAASFDKLVVAVQRA